MLLCRHLLRLGLVDCGTGCCNALSACRMLQQQGWWCGPSPAGQRDNITKAMHVIQK